MIAPGSLATLRVAAAVYDVPGDRGTRIRVLEAPHLVLVIAAGARPWLMVIGEGILGWLQEGWWLAEVGG